MESGLDVEVVERIVRWCSCCDNQFFIGVDIGGTNTRVALAPISTTSSHPDFGALEDETHSYVLLSKFLSSSTKELYEGFKNVECALKQVPYLILLCCFSYPITNFYLENLGISSCERVKGEG